MLVVTQMKTTVVTFFSFWLIMFGYINTGESIGLAFSTFATHAGFNITVMSAVVSIWFSCLPFFFFSRWDLNDMQCPLTFLSNYSLKMQISVFSFMTGFLSLNIPQWLSDINHVSLFKYGSVIMTRNEFDGMVFNCSTEQINSGACPFPTGEAVLQLLRFQDKNWDLYMGLFVAVVVAYRLLAWFALVAKVKSNRW